MHKVTFRTKWMLVYNFVIDCFRMSHIGFEMHTLTNEFVTRLQHYTCERACPRPKIFYPIPSPSLFFLLRELFCISLRVLSQKIFMLLPQKFDIIHEDQTNSIK